MRPRLQGCRTRRSRRAVNPTNACSALNTICSTRSSSAKKGDDREGNFLKDLREGFHRFSPKEAAAEINNWGGWWRNRYRENPDKAQRVLNEVLSMIKERKIKRNPGAAGVDLWNRLP